jgi:crotonobetainyl-CoA:carnitine CoA-transferase CaiB-like acyl-CoA transferase
MREEANHHPGKGPFAGLNVIELGASVAAPFACQILGELGARVIKIEKADGDDARRWGPPFWEGAGAFFQALNRNKESVVCEMRDAGQLGVLKAFILEHADIVIQNMRPGLVESLGLDGATLLAKRPSLIYCNLGAFGRTGPLNDRPGDDPRFVDNPARVANQQILYGLLDDILATQSTAYWVAAFEAVGVPCSPINDIAQMVAHPQTAALGLIQEVPGTGMRFIGLPLSFDGQRAAPYRAPPKLGEHTETILGRKTP